MCLFYSIDGGFIYFLFSFSVASFLKLEERPLLLNNVMKKYGGPNFFFFPGKRLLQMNAETSLLLFSILLPNGAEGPYPS